MPLCSCHGSEILLCLLEIDCAFDILFPIIRSTCSKRGDYFGDSWLFGRTFLENGNLFIVEVGLKLDQLSPTDHQSNHTNSDMYPALRTCRTEKWPTGALRSFAFAHPWIDLHRKKSQLMSAYEGCLAGPRHKHIQSYKIMYIRSTYCSFDENGVKFYVDKKTDTVSNETYTNSRR